MNEEERYLFDLHGYLVLENVLTADELHELNSYLDTLSWAEQSQCDHVHVGMDREYVRRGNADPRRGPVDFYAGLLLDWGPAFRRLATHERVHPYLLTLLGEKYRLDHQYAILMRRGREMATTHDLHGGAIPHHPDGYYQFHAGQFITNLVAVSFALTDATSETGGFCCIPGSHQSHFPVPHRFKQIEQPAPCIQQIQVKAGDVIIFTEAIAHGCLPWVANYERRALMFKNCPAYMRWENAED